MSQVPFDFNSKTSKEAAESLSPQQLRADSKLVYDAIAAAGTEGRTDDELEVALQLSHQTASARRRGLVMDGFVRDSGQVRLTRTRRNAAVWICGRQEVTLGAELDSTARPSNTVLRAGAQEILRLIDLSIGAFKAPEDMARLARWLLHIAKPLDERDPDPRASPRSESTP